jgi:hypothetical protein
MKTLLKRVIADDEKEERRMTIQGRTLGQLLQEKLAESKPTTLNEVIQDTQEKIKVEDSVRVSDVPYTVGLRKDEVNNPDHYKMGGVETIEFIEAKATEEELIGYLKFNVIKYLSRAKYKGHDIQDLKKAQWYLNRLVSKYGEQNENKF